MDSEYYIITELLESGICENKDVVWRHAMTHDDKKVTFWGKLESMRNIKSIGNQQVPFIVGILGVKKKPKHKYGTDISVDEGCFVTVLPLSDQIISLMGPDNFDKLLEQIPTMKRILSEN